MMYSDFPYRPPPPSYQASMQEYRLRLLLLDRQTGNPPNTGPGLAAVEPPPNYRNHLRYKNNIKREIVSKLVPLTLQSL